MTFESDVMRNAIESQQGQTLVRKFTNDLTGESTLERAAIKAQQENDALEYPEDIAEVRRLYQDDERDHDMTFHESEKARLILEEKCQLLEAAEQSSSSVRSNFFRNTVREKANKTMLSKVGNQFVDLKVYINGLEGAWKSKQIGAVDRFRRICGTLDSHKNAFAIFPTQNEYGSVLCGSLQFIISAAVNDDEISDIISTTVPEITQRAAQVASTLLLVRTHAMRQLFSRLYAQVFLYYRDVIEWYMKSRAARFVSSFNEKIKQQYDKAGPEIDRTMADMYRAMDLAQYARVMTHLQEQERRDKVRSQRQHTHDCCSLETVGQLLQQLLLSSHRSACIELSTSHQPQERQHCGALSQIAESCRSEVVHRTTVKGLATALEQFVVGCEGHAFLNNGKFWVPETDVSSRLANWVREGELTLTLWISSPDVTQAEFSSSRAAALTLLVSAWQVGLPVISHFCERPRSVHLASDRDVEEVGLIGLLYSLITQLLDFEVENDEFAVPEERLAELDGSNKSWPQALDLLSRLLRTTPHLRLCVIDGLNDLSFSGGAEWCSKFLAMLFEHQRSSTKGFRILLTTSGQSRVLPDYIEVGNRVFAQMGGREIIRGGKWMSDSAT